MRNRIREAKVKIYLLIVATVLLLAACGADLPSDVELFTQAQEHEGRQEFNDALKKYDLIIEKYADSELRYKAIFMKGYILFENLKDNKGAVEAFDLLLAQYPDCDLADDAAVIQKYAAEGGDIMSAFEDSLDQE